MHDCVRICMHVRMHACIHPHAGTKVWLHFSSFPRTTATPTLSKNPRKKHESCIKETFAFLQSVSAIARPESSGLIPFAPDAVTPPSGVSHSPPHPSPPPAHELPVINAISSRALKCPLKRPKQSQKMFQEEPPGLNHVPI